MGVVAALTLVLRQWLMPLINGFSDAAQAGDSAARRRFDRAHRLSVIVNVAQILVAGGVLARFAA